MIILGIRIYFSIIPVLIICMHPSEFLVIACIIGTVVFVFDKFRIPPVSRLLAEKVLTPGTVQVIAHRGGGYDAPENTIFAIRRAAQNGADAVEIDVEFSSDGVPILIHDDTVDRTTNGSGYISRMTWDELKRLDSAANHPTRDEIGPQSIPTLEEAVEECLTLNLRIYFDIKGGSSMASEALSTLYKKYPDLYEKSIVCSFYPQVIMKVRYADSSIVTALTHRRHYITRNYDNSPRPMSGIWVVAGPLLESLHNWSLGTWLWKFTGVSALLLHEKLVSRDIIELWEPRGINIVAWTVNTHEAKEYLAKDLKVSYITDCPSGTCPRPT